MDSNQSNLVFSTVETRLESQEKGEIQEEGIIPYILLEVPDTTNMTKEDIDLHNQKCMEINKEYLVGGKMVEGMIGGFLV